MIDISIIDEVRDALGDAAYSGYATRMLSEMRALGPVLKGSLARGDHEHLAQASHRAAGSAVSVGATALHGHLKAIEDTARADGSGLAALIDGFSGVVDATEAAIASFLNTQ